LKLEKENIQCLERLGLSPNQAKIYLGLLFHGKSSVKEISTLSGVAREEVYRNLKQLRKLGFVEKIFSYPNTYRPSPLNSVLMTMLKKKAIEMSTLQIETDKLLQNFTENEETDLNSNETFLIPEMKPLLDKAKNQLNTLKESLDTICSWQKGIGWLTSQNEQFIKALERKVKIRFVIEKENQNSQSLINKFKDFPSFIIKFVSTLPPACIGIYDKKVLFLDTETKAGFVKSPVIWTNNPNIVGMAQIYFDTIWNK